jgi:hypothetical protein
MPVTPQKLQKSGKSLEAFTALMFQFGLLGYDAV